jgi:hypothetical protein
MYNKHWRNRLNFLSNFMRRSPVLLLLFLYYVLLLHATYLYTFIAVISFFYGSGN